jgi:predicted permease
MGWAMNDPRPTPAWRRYLRFWGSDPRRDLDDELRFHLAARYDEYVAAGMSPNEARAEVARRFGDVENVRRSCADIDSQFAGESTMRDLVHGAAADLRYALRQLRRNTALSVAAIVCLALGIGANTAIFSVVDAVLFRPLPFPQADRLVLIGEGLPQFSGDNFGVISAPEFADFRRLDGRSFSQSAIYESASSNLSGGAAEPERVTALRASPQLFDVLGAAPARGRGFVAADSAEGTPNVVVLSDALWRRRFGADPGVIGRAVNVDGRPSTVVGVMSPSFHFPLPGVGGEPAELILPYKYTPALEQMRGNSYYTFFIARLAPDVTLESARRASLELASSLPRLHPDFYGSKFRIVADAFPLRDRAVRDVRGALLVLLAAVGLVLLIACINVSSLLLARASARRREISVRQALGASLGRLVRQFMAEGLVLVMIGGTLGVALAVAGSHLIAAHAPQHLLAGFQPAVDLRVLGVTAGVAIVTAIAFSLVPAIGQWRARGLAGALHDEGRGGTSGVDRQRGRRVLVVTQIAFALVLAALAGLMVRSLANARRTNPGFDSEHAITFAAGLAEARYPTAESVVQLEQRLIDELRRVPGVKTASATSNLPMGTPSRIAFAVEGASEPKVPIATSELVYDGYFDAMGIRLRDGRPFSTGDVRGTLPVVVVNETLARRYFGSRSAIGRRLKWGSPGSPNPWLTIVGVAADVKHDGLDHDVLPAVYFPARQQDSNAVRQMLRGASYVVRTNGAPAALMAEVQRAVRRVDPELPIVGLRTLADVIGVSVADRLFNTVLLAAFALLALALASVGVYGLITYSVVQRTREMGVRLAIGATPLDVLRLVVGQGTRLATVGVALGLAGAFGASRLARAMLFEVSPLDPVTFAASAVLLLAVAALASLVPALRASRIDPQEAIRAE